MKLYEPRARRVDERQSEARETTGARRKRKLAIDALSKLSIDTGVLARCAGRARAQGLELGIELLSIKPVLLCEACPSV